jgi:hypothetical protein
MYCGFRVRLLDFFFLSISSLACVSTVEPQVLLSRPRGHPAQLTADHSPSARSSQRRCGTIALPLCRSSGIEEVSNPERVLKVTRVCFMRRIHISFPQPLHTHQEISHEAPIKTPA